MGFAITLLAVEHLSAGDVLGRVGLEDTGEPDEYNEEEYSWATLPTGWTILFSNHLDFASEQRLLDLSRGGRALACLVEEHVMVSTFAEARDGKIVFGSAHISEEGVDHLVTVGTPPEDFDVRKAKAAALQDNDQEVDYFFEIAVELFEERTGYRHDLGDFDWGTPHFVKAQPIP